MGWRTYRNCIAAALCVIAGISYFLSPPSGQMAGLITWWGTILLLAIFTTEGKR